MPIVIVHPPDCDCGRHVDCARCGDTGIASSAWDFKGRHDELCYCRVGRKKRMEKK